MPAMEEVRGGEEGNGDVVGRRKNDEKEKG